MLSLMPSFLQKVHWSSVISSLRRLKFHSKPSPIIPNLLGVNTDIDTHSKARIRTCFSIKLGHIMSTSYGIHTCIGFTLIEVLIALSILAIALTALISNTSQSIKNAQHIHEKMMSHAAQMQGVTMAQLGLLPITEGSEITQMTQVLNQRIYWRIKINDAPIHNLQQLTITVSKTQSGPFHDPLIAFRYRPKN